MGGIGCGPHDWTGWEHVPYPTATPSYFVRYCRLCGRRQTQAGNGEKHGG